VAQAGPPGSHPAATAGNSEEQLEAGIEAWRAGQWGAARRLLEPLAREGSVLADPLQAESALRYLADSTLFDDSLGLETRTGQARGYISRLFDRDPEWSPPPATHGSAFYDLVLEVREERASAEAADCEAERLACTADLHELRVDHATLEDEQAALEKKFDEDLVPVVREVALNRGVALIPFGVGHFYNRNNALGASFLSAEVAFGATGLALMLDRIINLKCRREGSSFTPGSMTCEPPDSVSDEDVVLRRNLEQVFGFLFLGTLAVDVIVAQITFKKTRVISREEVPRKDLQRHLENASSEEERKARKRRRKRRDDKVEARPAPAMIPGGAGVGLKLRF
jgi:hypothetical protein